MSDFLTDDAIGSNENLPQLEPVESNGWFTNWKVKTLVLVCVDYKWRVVARMEDGRLLIYKKEYETIETAQRFAEGVRTRGNIFLGKSHWRQKIDGRLA